MSEEKTYTESEADLFFAKRLNGRTWELLEKPDRTKQEDELMIHSAHASCCHWLAAGTGLHHQRGEWLIARVYSVLGIAEASLRHANRCLELTHQHAGLMEDFDWAFAYECVARANAVAGHRDEAIRHIELAQKAGEAIQEDQDRKIFFADFNGGNWNQMR